MCVCVGVTQWVWPPIKRRLTHATSWLSWCFSFRTLREWRVPSEWERDMRMHALHKYTLAGWYVQCSYLHCSAAGCDPECTRKSSNAHQEWHNSCWCQRRRKMIYHRASARAHVKPAVCVCVCTPALFFFALNLRAGVEWNLWPGAPSIITVCVCKRDAKLRRGAADTCHQLIFHVHDAFRSRDTFACGVKKWNLFWESFLAGVLFAFLWVESTIKNRPFLIWISKTNFSHENDSPLQFLKCCLQSPLPLSAILLKELR